MKCKAIGHKVLIHGNIKSINHYHTISDEIEALIRNNIKELEVYIYDSISLTSSVIGYFSKLVHVDNIGIRVKISDNQLYELLEDLGLLSTLHVERL